MDSSMTWMMRLIFAAVFLVPGLQAARALGGTSATDGSDIVGVSTVMVLGIPASSCTGTVIRQDVVITAAHCVRSQQLAVAFLEDGAPALRPVQSIILHPASSDARRPVDIALVLLQDALPGRFVPVLMDDASTMRETGTALTVAGFGLQASAQPKTAGTLRQATVLAVRPSTERVIRIAAPQNDGALLICKGDSGGPVFAEAHSGRPVLAAILYGRDGKESAVEPTQCSRTGQAIRVSQYREWIDTQLARW